MMNKKNSNQLILQSGKKDILNYTLRELRDNPNAKVIQERGKTTIQLRTEDATIRTDIITHSFSEERRVTITPRAGQQDRVAFENEILQRLSDGETQNEIALTMGISQSQVSQIKRKHEKK